MLFSAAYVAEDKGFWKDAGVNVKLDLNWPGPQATNAVLAGKVDFACITAALFLKANARGQKLVAIANMQDRLHLEIVVSPAFAERAHLNASTTAEERARALRGARIAIDAPNGVPHTYLRYAANRAGLDVDRDLVASPVAFSAMLAALRSGQVDGITAGPPWSAMARKESSAVTVVSGPAGDFPELSPFNALLIITRPGFCESRAETCREVVAGAKNALGFMHEQQDETLALLRKRFEKIDSALVEETFRSLLESTPLTPIVGETGFVHAQDFLVGSKTLQDEEKLSSFASVYTNEYAR
jgi:ABC-type nitrate/sulfonate/bicarbonate transport system substrate-binding protein